ADVYGLHQTKSAERPFNSRSLRNRARRHDSSNMWFSVMTEKQSIVFVIDDDAAVREAVEDLLRSVGLGVESFGSTQEFLVSKRPDAPGCIVLDVRLPGLSGLEFQRTLARAGDRTPVIFLTGHADIEMAARAMKAGALEFLTKPYRDQALLDAVLRAIEKDRTRREN